MQRSHATGNKATRLGCRAQGTHRDSTHAQGVLTWLHIQARPRFRTAAKCSFLPGSFLSQPFLGLLLWCHPLPVSTASVPAASVCSRESPLPVTHRTAYSAGALLYSSCCSLLKRPGACLVFCAEQWGSCCLWQLGELRFIPLVT